MLGMQGLNFHLCYEALHHSLIPGHANHISTGHEKMHLHEPASGPRLWCWSGLNATSINEV